MRETERRMKRQFIGWKKIFANDVSEQTKDLYPVYIKNFQNPIVRKHKQPPPEISKRFEQMFYLKRHMDFFCYFVGFFCFSDSA